MLTFRFTGADGRMTEKETLTSGMIGKKVRLEFSRDWDNLTKTAVFMAGSVTRDVVGVTDVAVIPAEVLAVPLRQLYVGVYGVSDDGRVTPTIRALGPNIEPGMNPSGDEGTDPELPIWAQIQLEIEQLQEMGVDGEDGGYYIPAVTQQDESTVHLSFAASKDGMPEVASQKIILPVGPQGLAGADGKQGESGGYYIPEITQQDESTVRLSFAASKNGMTEVAGQEIVLPAGPQGSAGADGKQGKDGGYYSPVVTQSDDNTIQFAFMPSDETMPPIPPVAFLLPAAEAATGLSAEQVEALHAVVKNIGAWQVEDPAAIQTLISNFETAFGIAEEEEPHTHSYTAAVTTAATCTAAGVRTYTCACGESYTESIPAAGHRYVDGVCSVCGAEDPDNTPDVAVTLSGISAVYGGGEVAVGTAVDDLADIVVTGHYSDGTTAALDGYTLSGTIAEGDNTITVSYGGMSATFTVTGVAESGGGSTEETTGEFGLVIPSQHAGIVTLDLTPADADSMEITMILPAFDNNHDGAFVSNGEKWIGVYDGYKTVGYSWGNKPTPPYVDFIGAGKVTAFYESISTLSYTSKPIILGYADNKRYTVGYTLYEMVFYKDGAAVCDLKPTTVLGNLYDSVSGKIYSFTVTDGLSFA